MILLLFVCKTGSFDTKIFPTVLRTRLTVHGFKLLWTVPCSGPIFTSIFQH